MSKWKQRNLRVADMVVTPSGAVGMVMHVSRLYANVAYVQNGPEDVFLISDLHRATAEEIVSAGLSGVGCNEPLGGW